VSRLYAGSSSRNDERERVVYWYSIPINNSLSLIVTRGRTLEPFSYGSSQAMNVWISIKSFTIANFVEINPKRA